MDLNGIFSSYHDEDTDQGHPSFHDSYNVIPLFQCEQWNTSSKAGTMYIWCGLEKVLIIIFVVITGLLIYMLNIYKRKLQIGFKDKRIWIITLCLWSSIINFAF